MLKLNERAERRLFDFIGHDDYVLSDLLGMAADLGVVIDLRDNDDDDRFFCFDLHEFDEVSP